MRKQEWCFGCGATLIMKNAWMEDGCPCNSKTGCNNENLCRWTLLHRLQQRGSAEIAKLKEELAIYEKAYQCFAT